jgi:hypothetical protein
LELPFLRPVICNIPYGIMCVEFNADTIFIKSL